MTDEEEFQADARVEAAEAAETAIEEKTGDAENPEQVEVETADPEASGEEKTEEEEAMEARFLRLRADFDNYRRRVERDKANWSRQALERTMEALLPALDSFDLGLDNAGHEEADTASMLEGFQLTRDMLLKALERSGLQVIDAAGQPFDPELHEAISQMPSDEASADTVLYQTRRGYRLGDKLLRPAQVVVSCGDESTDDPGAS